MEENTSKQRDDDLFQALEQTKKKKKRRILLTVVITVVVVVTAAILGIGYLQNKVREEFAAASGEVLSHTVTTGTISTVVSGSGPLADMDLVSVTVPEGVTVTKVQVKATDTVSEGDILATVDMASVKSAMSQLQTEIGQLDTQIAQAEADEVSETVKAGVPGRLKAVYAAAGSNVADVMYEHGALALISLDGFMAVDIQTDALTAGDSVTVALSDGSTVPGSVETASGAAATILLSDNGPALDEQVTILNADGSTLGSGTLYVHSPLRVTGFAGTVASVRSVPNAQVWASTTLFTLTDTSHSANYDALLRNRSQLEETLLELLTIQRNGAVLATGSFSVHSVDYTQDSTSLVTLSPDQTMSVTISVDEGDILSLTAGQTVSVTVSSVSDTAFTGTLTEISKTATDGAYSAVVMLDKVEGMLPGMTASVSVQIEGVENALLIPIEALHQTSTGAYVFTSYDEALQEYGGKRDVVVGISNSSFVEIRSGLSEGDTVYYTEAVASNFGGMGNFGGRGENGFGGRGEDGFGGGQVPGGGQFPGGRGQQPGEWG